MSADNALKFTSSVMTETCFSNSVGFREAPRLHAHFWRTQLGLPRRLLNKQMYARIENAFKL